MRAKLSDAEFVERARASARRRSERQRLRKLESGKIQVNHWLTATAKERLDALATELNASPSEVVTAAILSYRQMTAIPPLPVSTIASPQTVPESLPLFEPASTETDSLSVVTRSAPGTLTERDDLIIRLHLEGFNKSLIAARLFDLGWRTEKGNRLSRDTISNVIKRAGLTTIHEEHQ